MAPAPVSSPADVDLAPDAFNVGIGRTIRGSLKRFLSLAVITMLGVTMLIGIRAACEDTRQSVDWYLDQQRVYDIAVMSTLGLSQADIDALSKVDGVDAVEGIYAEIAYTTVGTVRERVSVQSLSTEDMDQPVLVSGSLPQDKGEVAVTSKYLEDTGKRIGDTVTFTAERQGGEADGSQQASATDGSQQSADGPSISSVSDILTAMTTASSDVFATGTYTITGEVKDPTDLLAPTTTNAFRASSAADYAFYVDPASAVASAFTAARIRVADAQSLDTYSGAYTARIEEVEEDIRQVGEGRRDARTAELTQENAKLLDQLENNATMAFNIREQNIARMSPGSAEQQAARRQLEGDRAQTEGQLAQARDAISQIEHATWYVQDRASIASFASIDSDTASIETIGTVFPIIFFVVAVLISLTTATRMVEEERTLIGLYKALGYTRSRILSKYTRYTLFACLLGGLVGNVLGFIGLPSFIFTVFRAMYYLPEWRLGYNIVMSLGSVGLFALGVVGASWLACRGALRESPASLMRPKAPRAGSRIMLERVTPIWRHLGFLNKVTARNLFRYKKRLFMTVCGIAGCTALVICGFGINDTVHALSEKQYERVIRYDLIAASTEDDFQEAFDKLMARGRDGASGAAGASGAVGASGSSGAPGVANATGAAGDAASAAPSPAPAADTTASNTDSAARVSAVLPLHIDTVSIELNDVKESVELLVVPDDADISDYECLVDDSTGEAVTLPKEGAVIGKSAETALGAQTGTTLSVRDSAYNGASVKVDRVVRGYLGTTLYMSASAFRAAFGFDAKDNGILAKLTGSVDEQIAFAKQIRDDGWLTATSTAGLKRDFNKNFVLVQSVAGLITAMAAGLAFVVVSTLANTNISERERELATIKVLGFRRREVHVYLNKETFLLTGIGALLGVPLGWVLTESFTYILKMPSLYFDVEIEPMSYLYAVGFAFLFTLIVSLFTNRTLDRIVMVDALKSAE